MLLRIGNERFKMRYLFVIVNYPDWRQEFYEKNMRGDLEVVHIKEQLKELRNK